MPAVYPSKRLPLPSRNIEGGSLVEHSHMRLRSSQFVFLMLLICSLQIREEYASQLIGGAVAGRTRIGAQKSEASSADDEVTLGRTLRAPHHPYATKLAPADTAAHSIPGPMAAPAFASTAIVSHTSFRRA